jgi:prevent-host-death family protein
MVSRSSSRSPPGSIARDGANRGAIYDRPVTRRSAAMPTMIEAADADYPALLERAHAGDEVIIAKAGKPYARLVPLAEPAKPADRRQPGRLAHLNGELSDAFWERLPAGWDGN